MSAFYEAQQTRNELKHEYDHLKLVLLGFVKSTQPNLQQQNPTGYYFMSLSNLQNHFQGIIFNTNKQMTLFVGNDLHHRIQVYKNNYFGNLQKALSSIYPVCKKLVGDDCFEMMTYDYIDQHPSIHTNLNEYGEKFSLFIESNSRLDSLPYLANIANLEWFWHKVFNQENNVFLTIQVIQDAITKFGEGIIFKLPIHAKMISSQFPLIQIWEVCQPEYQGDFKVDVNQRDEKYFMLWQENYKIRMEVLSSDEKTLLDLIIKKMSFFEISKQYCNNNMTEILLNCVKKGLIRI